MDAMRTRLDVDAGVLLTQAAAGIGHDQAVDHHIGRDHADRVALVAATDGGAIQAAQRQRLLDAQVFYIEPALYLDRVTRRGLLDGGLDAVSGLYRPGGHGFGFQDRQGQQGRQPDLPT